MDAPAGSVMRLIDWIWSGPARETDNDTAKLAGLAGMWLFATSNRFIRDRATRALVSMLIDRPAIVAELLREFLTVDDPYVVERALAVGYGVALRTHAIDQLEHLGKVVLDRCFTARELPIHLLARDYARGIVDVAIRRVRLLADPRVIEPPYQSDWPSAITPYEEWERRASDSEDDDRTVRKILFYLQEGDWRHHMWRWLRYRLDDEVPEELLDYSVDGATMAIEGLLVAEDDPVLNPAAFALPDRSVAKAQTKSGRPLKRLEASSFASIPIQQVRSMILDDVFAMKYSKHLDDDVRSHYRNGRYAASDGQQSESIQKKYLWIALRRTQARLADRFKFCADDRTRGMSSFKGPWQIAPGRDIDPSCLIPAKAGSDSAREMVTWWAPFANTKFDDPRDDVEWVKDRSNIPEGDKLVNAVGPTGETWVVASVYVALRSVRPALPAATWRRRQFSYEVESVLVKAADSSSLVSWVSRRQRLKPYQPFTVWLRRPHLGECFLGEFPASDAWEAENVPYYHRSAWTGPNDDWHPPVAYTTLADGYFEDGDLDCGRDEVVDFRLPSAELVTELALRQSYQDGHFEDGSRRLVAWDPSITEPGPSALLVNRGILADYLKDQGLHLVLFAYGEKIAYSESPQLTGHIGRLRFFGTMLFDGRTFSGSLASQFSSPARHDSGREKTPRGASRTTKRRDA